MFTQILMPFNENAAAKRMTDSWLNVFIIEAVLFHMGAVKILWLTASKYITVEVLLWKGFPAVSHETSSSRKKLETPNKMNRLN